MNKKQVIKLSESDLHRIVKESINKTLNDEFLNNIITVDMAAQRAAWRITDSYFSFKGLGNVRNNNVDFSEETVKLRRRWLNLYHPLYSAIVDAVKNVLDSNDF